MLSDKGREPGLITIKKASQILGIKTEVIRYQVEVGKIELVEGKVSHSVCEMILEQQALYIGIKSFLKKHDNDRFESKYFKNRNKYIDFLEVNEYFGIKIIEPEDILFDMPEREDFYITKEDAQLLEYKSERFFDEFGLTEREKTKRIIKCSRGHLVSKEYIVKYLSLKGNDDFYTPSVTSFVRTIFDMLDVKQITEEDIVSVLEETNSPTVKKLLAEFFEYVAKYEAVKYQKVELKKPESKSPPAYSYEEFLGFAIILFNTEYDKSHNLTLKALETSIYVEMWMYLACHFICGWRSSAICDRWIYPALKNNDNPFKINVNTLKEDIINGNISDDTYEKITLYCIKRIEMANYIPQKEGEGKLRAEILPELRIFFGKLILIAEYHHIRSREGYMNWKRAATYRNWVKCKEFFGEDIYYITGKHSILSRRLNKSYLQGMEHTTRENGHTTLVAHVIASLARNHADINTTAIYLKDHGLTGESADVVLYMMLQRGVFGASLYSALITAYPESFSKMSIKEQSAIMEKISLSAYEMEMIGYSIDMTESMGEMLLRKKDVGKLNSVKMEETDVLLKEMFSIVQGHGKAKDEGIYCRRRALGFSCEKPTCESCIANLCPHHIFTSEGIPALVKVIKEYARKESITGNKKYGIVLKKMIIPAFQDIINAIIKEMSKKEKASVKKMISEAMNEQTL